MVVEQAGDGEVYFLPPRVVVLRAPKTGASLPSSRLIELKKDIKAFSYLYIALLAFYIAIYKDLIKLNPIIMIDYF